MSDTLTQKLLKEGAFEGEAPEFDPGEYAGVTEVTESVSELTSDTLKDYSNEALELDRDTGGAVVWQSTDLESFGKDGKINVLRVTEDFIILDVFKPGCHREKQVRINPGFCAEIREYLTENPLLKWNDIFAGWQDGADKDTHGGVFAFHREKQISKTHKLVWKGKHTNPTKAGMSFNVEDTLELEFV